MLYDILTILLGLLMYFISGYELKTKSDKNIFNDYIYKSLISRAKWIKYIGLFLVIVSLIRLLIKIY
jgi:hypothetical protein